MLIKPFRDVSGIINRSALTPLLADCDFEVYFKL